MGRFVRLGPDRMGELGRSLLLSSVRSCAGESFERLADGGISSTVKSSSSELSDMHRNLEVGGVFSRLMLSRDSFLK